MELAESLDLCKQQFMDRGPEVWRHFPQKVSELHELYLSLKTVELTPTEFDMRGGNINPSTHRLANTLKRHVSTMISDIDALKLWITLKLPKIEDGNNFSVQVQEELISILSSGRSSGLALLDSLHRHLANRAEIISRLRKYPNVQDYHRSVAELDLRQHIILTHTTIDLRNNYAILFDLINKNFTHIDNPKGRSESSMHAGML